MKRVKFQKITVRLMLDDVRRLDRLCQRGPGKRLSRDVVVAHAIYAQALEAWKDAALAQPVGGGR